MTAHPNRGRGNPARNPAPEEIRAAREAAGLTQAEAAALIYYGWSRWQEWEYGKHRMHPALWDLFRHRAGLLRIPFRAHQSAEAAPSE